MSAPTFGADEQLEQLAAQFAADQAARNAAKREACGPPSELAADELAELLRLAATGEASPRALHSPREEELRQTPNERPAGHLTIYVREADPLTDAEATTASPPDETQQQSQCRALVLRVAPAVSGNSVVRVWEGAETLCAHLVLNKDLVRGRQCIELGSGVGACGLTAAALGASSVLLTDLAAAQPYLEYNMRTNLGAAERARTRALVYSWGSPIDELCAVRAGLGGDSGGKAGGDAGSNAGGEAGGKAGGAWDVVLCADLLYDLALMPPLLAALELLVPPGSATTVYLSMLLRPKTLGAGWCREFWDDLAARGFALRRVPVAWAPRRAYVLSATRVGAESGTGRQLPAAPLDTDALLRELR